jgi:hypothetical protein
MLPFTCIKIRSLHFYGFAVIPKIAGEKTWRLHTIGTDAET